MSSDATSIYPQDNINSPNLLCEQVYEFDRFRLDAAHRMLYENNQPVALAPKVVETLIALVEKRGEVVSKDELMNRVWAGSVVEESNLTQNIYLLRKALGNTSHGQPLIESFRRRGYRFNADIRLREGTSPIAEEATVNGRASDKFPAAKLEVGNSLPATKADHKRKRYFAAGAIAAGVLLIAVAFIGNRSFKTKTPNLTAPTLKITRLTPDLDISGAVAFTRDSNHFAYVLVEKGMRSLWLKDLTTGSATRVLPPLPIAEGYGFPQFSSDGQTIYYAANRNDAPNGTIVRLSQAGGSEQKIAVDVISPFALSPDEKQMAFINSRWQLIIAETDGSGERVLAERDRKKAGFVGWSSILSWSPDGERIAVCGGEVDEQGKRKAELLEVSPRDGSIKPISIPNWDFVDDAIWLRDQTGLMVVARETATAPFQIWKVDYPSGTVTRITNDTNSYDDIALSADSRRLIATQRFYNANIWAVQADAPAQAKQLTFGSAASDGFDGIAFTTDGKVIYTSPRDGHIDLWQMNPDGSEQRQLTKNAGDHNDRPNVTPDGRFIVFRSSRSGKDQIWRMDVDGANPEPLTHAEFSAGDPAVSPDGEWVYFTGDVGDAAKIWRVSSGGGEMIRVSSIKRAWSPSLSPDGKSISYAFYDNGASQPWQIGVMRASDGARLRTFDTPCYRLLTRWTADSKALICMKDEAMNLWQLPIDGGKPRRLTSFDSGLIFNFALSPGRKQFVVSRGNHSGEAVLLEGF